MDKVTSILGIFTVKKYGGDRKDKEREGRKREREDAAQSSEAQRIMRMNSTREWAA